MVQDEEKRMLDVVFSLSFESVVLRNGVKRSRKVQVPKEKTSSATSLTAEADSMFHLHAFPPSLPASRPGHATISIHS